MQRQSKNRRIWRLAHENVRSPVAPAPAIDFERDVVIVAALGRQPGAGSSVAIASVRDRNHLLEIVIDVHLVPANCDGFPAVSHPTIVVRVPATRSTAIFRDRVFQAHC